MTLPLELFEQQELQRLALAGRPPAPAASAAACQTEPPPRAHSTSQTNSADAGGHADAARHQGRADRHPDRRRGLLGRRTRGHADGRHGHQRAHRRVPAQGRHRQPRRADRRGGDRDGVRRDAERGAPPLSDRPTTASRVRRKFLEMLSSLIEGVRGDLDANVQQLVAQADPRRLCQSEGADVGGRTRSRRRTPSAVSASRALFGTEFRRQRRSPVASVSAVAGSRGACGTTSSTMAFGSLSAASHRGARTGKNDGPPMRGRAATKRCVPATAEDVERRRPRR